MSEYPFEGMPLCRHRIQFDCEQCLREDITTENRRMQFILQHVISPGRDCTLWDDYKELGEEFWKAAGL